MISFLLFSCFGFLLESLTRVCLPDARRSRSSAESFSFSLGTIFYLLLPTGVFGLQRSPGGKNKAHLQKYIDFPRRVIVRCKKVDLVLAFNGSLVFAARHFRGHFFLSFIYVDT